VGFMFAPVAVSVPADNARNSHLTRLRLRCFPLASTRFEVAFASQSISDREKNRAQKLGGSQNSADGSLGALLIAPISAGIWTLDYGEARSGRRGRRPRDSRESASAWNASP
jgi:hypothetical protein